MISFCFPISPACLCQIKSLWGFVLGFFVYSSLPHVVSIYILTAILIMKEWNRTEYISFELFAFDNVLDFTQTLDMVLVLACLLWLLWSKNLVLFKLNRMLPLQTLIGTIFMIACGTQRIHSHVQECTHQVLHIYLPLCFCAHINGTEENTKSTLPVCLCVYGRERWGCIQGYCRNLAMASWNIPFTPSHTPLPHPTSLLLSGSQRRQLERERGVEKNGGDAVSLPKTVKG